ncbi:unnamed protein product [Nippostrongylus brasiliensis]|uniref:40S ribosomal protein S5 n=1 Tax=Nippostrongylus brasiliensis TaxID=27835 RepID=A0A0N4XX91_NIPBR|nr:unnamed protein product [Nippostrongylus brasiliensis]
MGEGVVNGFMPSQNVNAFCPVRPAKRKKKLLEVKGKKDSYIAPLLSKNLCRKRATKHAAAEICKRMGTDARPYIRVTILSKHRLKMTEHE